METIINLIVIGNSWQGEAVGPTFAAYNIKCMEVRLPLLGYKVTSGFRCMYVLRGSIERKIISEINEIISLIK